MTENPLSVFGSAPLAIEAERYNRPYGNQQPYEVIDGIAVIDIRGALTKEVSFIEKLLFGATSYTDIEDQIDAAVQDGSIKGILLRVDSPGGAVAGMFKAARAIAAANKEKPVFAATGGVMCSAAYCLASAAGEIFADESAIVGSIGTMTQRIDLTAMDEEIGVKYNILTSGKKKAYGNPHTPMSADEEKELRAMVENLAEQFFEVVAKNRNTTASAIRSLEAGVFNAAAAIKHKLVDHEGTEDDAMNALRKRVARTKSSSTTAAAAVTPTQETPVENTEKSAAAAAEVETTAKTETAATDTAASAAADKTATTEGTAAASEKVADKAAAPAAEQAAPVTDAAYEIAQLCHIAGKTGMLAEFILQRKTVAQVREALVSAKADGQAPEQISSRTLPMDGTVAKQSIEDNPIVKAATKLAESMKGSK